MPTYVRISPRVLCEQTRMLRLAYGNSMMTCSAVLTQMASWTDEQNYSIMHRILQ